MVIIVSSRDYSHKAALRRMTRFFAGASSSKHAAHGRNDIFYRETEMLEQHAGRRGFAERIDSHDRAARIIDSADVLAPEIGHPGFDRDSRDVTRQHAFAISRVLALE